MTHVQMAYKAPFLDALRMTPEVRAIVTGSGESRKKTTREWEELITQVQIAWHALQENIWRGSHGWRILEGSEWDTSSISGLRLPDEPANFTFVNPQEFGKLSFDSPSKREGRDEGKEEDDVEDDKMEDTEQNDLGTVREAVKDLDRKMHIVLMSVRADQIAMMDHL